MFGIYRKGSNGESSQSLYQNLPSSVRVQGINISNKGLEG